MKHCEKSNPECHREHKCPKYCYEECGDCEVLVQAELPCGHRQEVRTANCCIQQLDRQQPVHTFWQDKIDSFYKIYFEEY